MQGLERRETMKTHLFCLKKRQMDLYFGQLLHETKMEVVFPLIVHPYILYHLPGCLDQLYHPSIIREQVLLPAYGGGAKQGACAGGRKY